MTESLKSGHADIEAERDAALAEVEKQSARVVELELDNRSLFSERDAARAECERLRTACVKMNDEVCQSLGKVLGFPWFKDDQENFPGATEANGVFVGEHVAETLADKAAATIAGLRTALAGMHGSFQKAKAERDAARRSRDDWKKAHNDREAESDARQQEMFRHAERATKAEAERDTARAECERLERELLEAAKLTNQIVNEKLATIAGLREAINEMQLLMQAGRSRDAYDCGAAALERTDGTT